MHERLSNTKTNNNNHSHHHNLPPRPQLPSVHFQNKQPPQPPESQLGIIPHHRTSSSSSLRKFAMASIISLFVTVVIFFVFMIKRQHEQLHLISSSSLSAADDESGKKKTIIRKHPLIKKYEEAFPKINNENASTTERPHQLQQQHHQHKERDHHDHHHDHNLGSLSTTSPSSSAPAIISINMDSINKKQQNNNNKKVRPSYSLTKSNRIICQDIDPNPANPRNIQLFDDYEKKYSMFHACQIRKAWISGTFATSGEQHIESLIIFPPSLTAGSSSSSDHHHYRPFPKTIYEFPKTPFSTPYAVTIEEQSENTIRKELKYGNDGQPLPRPHDHFANGHVILNQRKSAQEIKMEDPQKQLDTIIGPRKFINGNVLVVSPHYCCAHPVHFLEGLGATASALEKWLKKEASSSAVEDLFEVNSISQVLIFSGQSVPIGSFNYHVTKSVVFGAYQRAGLSLKTAVTIPITSILGRNFRYDRLLFFGARYDIWPNEELAMRFIQDFKNYLQYRQEHGLVKKQGEKTGDNTNNEDGQEKVTLQKEDGDETAVEIRKIVYMKRSSGRKISDQEDFIQFLTRALSLLANFEEQKKEDKDKDKDQTKKRHHRYEVVSVSAMEHSVDELNHIIGDAKIMISIHGADLVNMLFMNMNSGGDQTNRNTSSSTSFKNPAIIEINPIFFFEPRFFEMSARLNFNYFSFNCGSPRCAYGGHRLLFRANMPLDIQYDEYDNHRLTYSEGGNDDEEDENNKKGKKNDNNNKSKKKKIEITAHWPVSGYVGKVCGRPCLDVLHKSSLQLKFYSSFRGSDVAMTSSEIQLKQFAGIFFDALVSVGWTSIDKAAFMKKVG